MEDVRNNSEGRIWRFEDERRPAAMSAIEELLSRRLSYNVSPSAPAFRAIRQSFKDFGGPPGIIRMLATTVHTLTTSLYGLQMRRAM